MSCENGCFLYLRLTFFYKRLQKYLNCPTMMTARNIGLQEHATPRPANDHGCRMVFTTCCQMRRISLPNGPGKFLRHAFSAVLSNYNITTAYTCRRFILTTALISYCVSQRYATLALTMRCFIRSACFHRRSGKIIG